MKNILILLLVLAGSSSFAQEKNLPIIDIHLHAYEAIQPGIPASWTGEQEAQALKSPESAEKHMQQVLSQMDKHNVVLALTSSTSLNAIKTWKEARPDAFIAGIQTNDEGMPIVSPDSLKMLKNNGVIEVFGELGFQYFGVSPDDP